MTKFKVNQFLSADPTRTVTLRRQFIAEMKRRYTGVKRLVVESIVVNNAFGIRTGETSRFANLVLQQAAQPEEFSGELNEQVEKFDHWIKEELEAGIGAEDSNNSWFVLFILAAFARGLKRGRAELARGGWNVQQYPQQMPQAQLVNQPFIRDRVQLVLDKTLAEIKNVNEATRTTIRGILAEALAEGVHPREVARRITKAIDEIGIRRAILIARTEIIAAHHLANIAEYRQAGVLGIKLLAEWLTAGDRRVCPRCQALAARDNGYGAGIYTLSQIEFMIPVHPACRCMALPVDMSNSQN